MQWQLRSTDFEIGTKLMVIGQPLYESIWNNVEGSFLGLCIIYFKWYDTYHDTHEVIFDMYQQYICLV